MPARIHDHRRARPARGILIFAYGSNLDPRQMSGRCPDARAVGPAYLPDHRLEFRGWSSAWSGPVATFSPAPRQSVPGALYLCGAADLAALDRAEGHPFVYRREPVDLVGRDGHLVRAHAYVLRNGARRSTPSAHYFRAVYRGYSAWGLPIRVLIAAVRKA